MEQATRLKLLIVDDEEGMRRTLRRIMLAKGFDVDLASNGREAIEKAAAMRPDCILMDIKMPQMNGVDAFRHIKRICPDTFVIFMTAYSASELVDEARLEGGIQVFPKPLEIDSVCALIDRTSNSKPLLLVDDDEGFCRSLERVLAEKGFDVKVARGLGEAVEIFERRPRGIVLLDVKLNGDNGLDLLPKLRELNSHISVVLITGFSDQQTALDEALHAGVCCSLTKPFNVNELLQRIQEAS